MTAQALSKLISKVEIDELLDWEGYQGLMAMAPSWAAAVGGNPQEDILDSLLTDEINKRIDALESARATVDAQILRWGSGVLETVVLDTSVYLMYPKKLEDIDWAKFQTEGSVGFRLAVPMIVIDELDATKSDDMRGRASYSLAVLDRVLRSDGTLADNPVRVMAELFSDPMGHRRLPINDQEIIARALAVQALTGNPVTLLACDTGMSLRAREAGLREIKLERRDPKQDKAKPKSH